MKKYTMSHAQQHALVAMRIVLGWMFLYAGWTKIINPAWSAEGYLKGAQTFTGFFQWLASPTILPAVNLINEWALFLIGLSLIFGIFVRLSSICGIILMLMYYLPILKFPYPNEHSLLIDEHIVYAAAFFVLAYFRAGRYFGLEHLFAKSPLHRRMPAVRHLLG
jgi:thiosulfate dehydrogenase (quinone) large subunit